MTGFLLTLFLSKLIANALEEAWYESQTIYQLSGEKAQIEARQREAALSQTARWRRRIHRILWTAIFCLVIVFVAFWIAVHP